MSADVLREAAALMRTRAETATPGPWAHYGHSIIRPAELKDGKAPSYSAAYHKEDGEHIASWHPAVALAVANWLDNEAAEAERLGSVEQPNFTPAVTYAYVLALAYLGRDA